MAREWGVGAWAERVDVHGRSMWVRACACAGNGVGGPAAVGCFGQVLWAPHLRLAVVAVDVLQVRDDALRIARVSRVHRVHRRLRCSGQIAEVEPLVAHLPTRIVQLALGAARLYSAH